MEAPEGIVIGLKAIRPTFSLYFNPKGRVTSERSFDVNGNARELTYDPRWELWDRDVSNIPYRVMVLEEPETRQFLPPGQWLLDLLYLIDPARYDGNVEKMIQALVDDENEYVKKLAKDDFERLIDALSNYFTPAKGGGMVTV